MILSTLGIRGGTTKRGSILLLMLSYYLLLITLNTINFVDNKTRIIALPPPPFLLTGVVAIELRGSSGRTSHYYRSSSSTSNIDDETTTTTNHTISTSTLLLEQEDEDNDDDFLEQLQLLQQRQRQQQNQRITIVDRDAIMELEAQGINASHPKFFEEPPGHQANPNDYPFFAYWEKAGCGASIVHDDILLTAAHCLRGETDPHRIMSIRFNSKYRTHGGFTRSISYYAVHPDRGSKSRQSHDFVLLKVNETILFHNTNDEDEDELKPTGAKIVPLNHVRANPSRGDPVWAVGFGALIPTKPSPNSDLLMDVQLEALSNTLCRKQHGIKSFKEDVMFCVGTKNGTKDTCRGDSGGPILAYENPISSKNLIQVGMVSWGGKECAHPEQAGVAARIDSVLDWIHDQICRLSSYPPLVKCNPMDTTSYNHRLKDYYTHHHDLSIGADEEVDDKRKKQKQKQQQPDKELTIEEKKQRGLFDLKVTVQHDYTGWQNSWTFTHMNSFSLLYWQPYGYITNPNAKVGHIFQNLSAGKYKFAITDAQKDGLCCGHLGVDGGITIINEVTGDVLWQHFGQFGGFVSVVLDLDSTGRIKSDLDTSNEWINPIEMIDGTTT